MDLPWSFCFSFNPNNYQKRTQMSKLLSALLPFFGTVLLCFSGCTTVPKSTSVDFSSVSSSVDSIDKSLDKAIRAKTSQTAKPALEEAKKEVLVVKQKVSEVQAQVIQVQGQRDWWQKEVQSQQIKVSSLENRVSHLEHLLFLCSALISIVAGGIGWSLFKDIPYGAWVVGGIVLGSFTTSWFALGHLL